MGDEVNNLLQYAIITCFSGAKTLLYSTGDDNFFN